MTVTAEAQAPSPEESVALLAQRRLKLDAWRKEGNAYPNTFKRHHYAEALQTQYATYEEADFLAEKVSVRVAGRIMLKRLMGKASFIQLQDMTGPIQVYLTKDQLGEAVYESFKHWDLGDIVGVTGALFKTKTNELTVRAETIELLTKSLQPLPDKFHGLSDQEMRYRRRYLDLMVNEASRRVFKIRAKTITFIRDFLTREQFLEVETPMMQVMAGGAAARPFITHHNALDMPLYLRIAPELYLKRLVVGGFERVFEINRNFRNEGLSTRHNPEFTMVEFYQAYADYRDLITLSERLFQALTREVLGTMQLEYQGHTIDFSQPFIKKTVKEAILEFNPALRLADIESLESLKHQLTARNIPIPKEAGVGKLQIELFEKTVEEQLIQPTFITEYPTEVSPLARRNNHNPDVTDRFELFIAGREIANGFSELNDPEDQAARFKEQMHHKEAGDLEAMPYDEDYITALEYGMPPTAGEGIGIDRLVMLLANAPSIRDVILFPHMRPV